MLNVPVINVVSTKSINYNITLILRYVPIYMYVYRKINIHPRCCISNTLHELTPKSAGWWLTQKLYENHLLFQKECSWPYDFYGRPTMLAGQIVCALFMLKL